MVRRFALPLAVVLVAALVIGAVVSAPRWLPGLRAPAAPAAVVPSLAGASGWLGTTPLSDDSLRAGPLALLTWSDTDPLALDALPVLEAWKHAYAPFGVRVVSVHVPDFAFAADPAVPAAVRRRLAPSVPVVLDASLAVTSRLGGLTDGPHLLVAAPGGAVRVDTVGLAGFAAGELALREIVAQTHADASLPPAPRVPASRAVHTVYLGTSRSPEGPLAGLPAGVPQTFTAEFRYQQQGRPGVAMPVGAWTPGADGLVARRGGPADFVAIRYSAARVGVVAGPPPGGRGRLWVLCDERWPGPEAREADVTGDAGGAWVEVIEPRLYWLVHAAGEHLLQLSPDREGLTIHAFVLDGVRGGAARE